MNVSSYARTRNVGRRSSPTSDGEASATSRRKKGTNVAVYIFYLKRNFLVFFLEAKQII